MITSIQMIQLCGFVLIVALLPLQVRSGLADLKITEQVTNQARDTLKDCRLTLQSSCPDNLNIKFNLFTRQNEKGSQLIKVTESKDNIEKSFFNPGNPNKVIIHGFKPREYISDLLSVKDAYLSKEDVNVWMVDWSKLAANGVCVAFSMTNTEHVAKCTAQLIGAIKRHAPESYIHVVAYRAGVKVAHELSEAIEPLKLNRITGISPKGGKIPVLSPRGSKIPIGIDFYRLNTIDAGFIDTIHTSPFLPNSETFGHVDFYVNPHLPHQPGCEKLDKGKSKCDQVRALQYFAESITTEVGFLAWECKNFAEFTLGNCRSHDPLSVMGEFCPVGASGTYVLFTAEESPFALGHLEGNQYQEKQTKMGFNLITKPLTSMENKVEKIYEATPDIVKESGLDDMVKSKLENQVRDLLRGTVVSLGLKGVKALAAQVVVKKMRRIGNVDRETNQ